MYLYIYTYTSTYLHTHIHTYTYTSTHTHRCGYRDTMALKGNDILDKYLDRIYEEDLSIIVKDYPG